MKKILLLYMFLLSNNVLPMAEHHQGIAGSKRAIFPNGFYKNMEVDLKKIDAVGALYNIYQSDRNMFAQMLQRYPTHEKLTLGHIAYMQDLWHNLSHSACFFTWLEQPETTTHYFQSPEFAQELDFSEQFADQAHAAALVINNYWLLAYAFTEPFVSLSKSESTVLSKNANHYSLSENGEVLALIEGTNFSLWNTTTGEFLARFSADGHFFEQIAFSSLFDQDSKNKSQYIAGATNSGRVIVWKIIMTNAGSIISSQMSINLRCANQPKIEFSVHGCFLFITVPNAFCIYDLKNCGYYQYQSVYPQLEAVLVKNPCCTIALFECKQQLLVWYYNYNQFGVVCGNTANLISYIGNKQCTKVAMVFNTGLICCADTFNGKKATHDQLDPYACVSFIDGQQKVLIHKKNRSLQIWDPECNTSFYFSGLHSQVAVAHDDRLIITLSGAPDQKMHVCIWDAQTHKLLKKIDTIAQDVNFFKLNSAGTLLTIVGVTDTYCVPLVQIKDLSVRQLLMLKLLKQAKPTAPFPIDMSEKKHVFQDYEKIPVAIRKLAQPLVHFDKDNGVKMETD